jgi:hypothetical protein
MGYWKGWQNWFVGLLAAALGITMAMASPAANPELQLPVPAPAATAPLESALTAADEAVTLTPVARTTGEWGPVITAWTQAITHLQAVPTDSPQRVFAQRQGREYVQQLAIAQQQGAMASRPRIFPTLGSQVLDEQIGLYLSYLATFGPPDVLVIGSSRALQGIDPAVLQNALRGEGFAQARVYTFGVNGATAQMMSFVLRQVLLPEQLPKLLLWAGGSRSFNSGRVDRTFASLLASPGYRAIQAGHRPSFDWSRAGGRPAAPPLPVSAINGQGFLPVTDAFDPTQYYLRFPRVSGQYDSTYQPFRLEGVQTLSLRAIAAFANTQGIPLVFVNLPLSDDYLDAVRLGFERQFQGYLRQEANRGNFQIIDLLEQWRRQNRFFADPSHLNAAGAEQLSRQLANLRAIPWGQIMTAPAPTAG